MATRTCSSRVRMSSLLLPPLTHKPAAAGVVPSSGSTNTRLWARTKFQSLRSCQHEETIFGVTLNPPMDLHLIHNDIFRLCRSSTLLLNVHHSSIHCKDFINSPTHSTRKAYLKSRRTGNMSARTTAFLWLEEFSALSRPMRHLSCTASARAA